MVRFLTILFLFPLTLLAQPVGSVKTEQYQADFEKKQSIEVVANYTDTIKVPIQLLKIGFNDELYEMYPELKQKRVGLGVTNIVIEFLEYTGRFTFTEEKEEIKQRMIAQDKASDKGVSSNKIEVKGNVVLAKYFVYIEVYDFSVSEDDVVKLNGVSTITQTTQLGLQIKFVNAETGEVIVGSGLGEASTVKTESILGDISDDVKFNQSTIGTSTKKALETAASRIITRLIAKGVFKS
jgi:curli biogenesis system outer membrane secretion channel CsgG